MSFSEEDCGGSEIFPYILEILSSKPDLVNTFDDLCKELEEKLRQERLPLCNNLPRAIYDALEVAEYLGIVCLGSDILRALKEIHKTVKFQKELRNDAKLNAKLSSQKKQQRKRAKRSLRHIQTPRKIYNRRTLPQPHAQKARVKRKIRDGKVKNKPKQGRRQKPVEAARTRRDEDSSNSDE